MGRRLPDPLLPVTGELCIYPHGSMWRNTKKLRAELRVNDETVVPPLLYAWVIRITTSGIVITGTEYIARRPQSKSAVDSYRQTWWCKVEVPKSIIERLTTGCVERPAVPGEE